MKIMIGSLIEAQQDQLAIALEANETIILIGQHINSAPFPGIYLKPEEVIKLKEFLNKS